jgi:hypothetical protein
VSAAARLIALDLATAGMVLAADLRDEGGAVLLPAGATLSEASLKSLGRRGVDTLSVQDPDDDGASGGAPSEAEQLRRCARLERLFRHSKAVGASATLFAYLQRFRKEG